MEYPNQLITDQEYEQLFVKIAEEYPQPNYKAYQDFINERFKNYPDVLNKFAMWEKKLTLDRTKLKDIFFKEHK